MKKLVLFTLVLFCISCGTSTQTEKASLVGTWKFNTEKTQSALEEFSKAQPTITAEIPVLLKSFQSNPPFVKLNADKSYEIQLVKEARKGTYSFTEDKIILTPENTKDELEVLYHFEDGGKSLIYQPANLFPIGFQK